MDTHTLMYTHVLTCMCVYESTYILACMHTQADEKLAAANQSLEVTRRQKSEQDARYRYAIYVYMYIHTYIHTYIQYAHIHIYERRENICMYTYMYIGTYVCMYVRKDKDTYTRHASSCLIQGHFLLPCLSMRFNSL